MPAFIENGPDIPERLLQLHEDDEVVFFCGAGISYPAELPSYKGLVNKLYERLGVTPDTLQQMEIRAGHYDRAIGLLESHIVEGKQVVRKEVHSILKPNYGRSESTRTHQALLTLSKNSSGYLRLVTTNFDRIFEYVRENQKLSFESFRAPCLPVPKDHWNGLVYLHGLLPEVATPSRIHDLVLSSGDFGLAYLIDRWAARFVAELFRNFTVCFVGYSINDPVLRYMMDALAVDELPGTTKKEVFAFASYSKGEQEQKEREWLAKNVTPILYKMHKSHYYLHKTLSVWADTYRDGARGKQMIVAQHATKPPLASSTSDFAVGRVLWALTNDLAAKHFANLNPVPPLAWLKPFSEKQFTYYDLFRFGVTPKLKVDKELTFSLIDRPSPYTFAPHMTLTNHHKHVETKWDDIMRYLAQWLIRHLDDPELILWLAKNGVCLHGEFSRLLDHRIRVLEGLDQQQLDDIRRSSPRAIPGPTMRILWELFLSGRVLGYSNDFKFFDWKARFEKSGLSTFLKMELLTLLTPYVQISRPIPFFREEDQAELDSPERIRDFIEWRIGLLAGNLEYLLNDLDDKKWQEALPGLLEDINALLLDVFDLKRAMQGADDKYDYSHIHQPSISKHGQNRHFEEWTILVELLREAWLKTLEVNTDKAKKVAVSWFDAPYPIFKRLAFFAATQSDVLDIELILSWLKHDSGWWFWSMETKREILQLLGKIAESFEGVHLLEIERLLEKGPPRKMFRDGISGDDWQYICDSEIWPRLGKLKLSGAKISERLLTKMDEIGFRHPAWDFQGGDEQEFSFWMSEADEVLDDEADSLGDQQEIVSFLEDHESKRNIPYNKWHRLCADDFKSAKNALLEKTQSGKWPIQGWKTALSVWANEKDQILEASWNDLSDILVEAPKAIIAEIAHELAYWLEKQASTVDKRDVRFWTLSKCVINSQIDDAENNTGFSPFDAFSSVVGMVTEALFKFWYRREPKINQGLLPELEEILISVCQNKTKELRAGRFIIGQNSVSLFMVDGAWSREHIIPMFFLEGTDEDAIAVWSGFFWSFRAYRPFLKEIKSPLLAVSEHCAEFGELVDKYGELLCLLALEYEGLFTSKELRQATNNLPERALVANLQFLRRSLDGAAEKVNEFWTNRVLPYLKMIWPKDERIRINDMAEQFAHICISAKDKFDDAVELLRYWLVPIEYPGHLIDRLADSGLCVRFPEKALLFLSLITPEEATFWVPAKFKQCLDSMIEGKDQLMNDQRYIRLANFYERRGS